MKDNKTAPRRSLRDSLRSTGRGLARYAVLWFILLLAGVYGFVAFRIVVSQAAQPSEADVSAQVQATATPHIDQTVVSQLQSLQDHSVNVQTLFDQARSNPFQE